MQISTAYGGQKEGSLVLPRNRYTAIRGDKPKSKDDAKRPEFKVCKFTTEAIITEGSEHPDCFPEDYSAEGSRPLSEIEQELEQSGTFGVWFGGILAGIGSGVAVPH